jgi:hypothetical protein
MTADVAIDEKYRPENRYAIRGQSVALASP